MPCFNLIPALPVLSVNFYELPVHGVLSTVVTISANTELLAAFTKKKVAGLWEAS